MSHINELIEKLCPNGVERKKLVDVANVLYGCPFDSNLFCEDSHYIPLIRIRDVVPGYSTTFYSGDYSDEFIIRKGDILVGMDGNFNLAKWNSIDALLNQRVCKIESKNLKNVLNGFLYHYLGPKFKEIENNTAAGSVKHLSAAVINKIQIPIPPLEIQNRIVEILDHFTNLTANLTAELNLRRKQFEHYREKMLSLDGVPGVEWKKLGDVCDFIRGPFGGALKKEIFVDEGYAVYEQQHAIYNVFEHRYFVTKAKYDEMKRFHVCTGDIIMSCSGTMGKTAIIPENHLEGLINQALLIIRPNNCLFNKFIKYYLDSDVFASVLSKNTQGGAIQNVASVPILKNISIPVPPLAVQQSIVDKLDKFTALIENIEKELDLRQKQYEYYREQLLSFK